MYLYSASASSREPDSAYEAANLDLVLLMRRASLFPGPMDFTSAGTCAAGSRSLFSGQSGTGLCIRSRKSGSRVADATREFVSRSDGLHQRGHLRRGIAVAFQWASLNRLRMFGALNRPRR